MPSIIHLLKVFTVLLPTLSAARKELNDMGDRGSRRPIKLDDGKPCL